MQLQLTCLTLLKCIMHMCILSYTKNCFKQSTFVVSVEFYVSIGIYYLHRHIILSLYSAAVPIYIKLDKKPYKRYLILISAAFNWLSLPTISTYNILFEALSQHAIHILRDLCCTAVGMLQRACVYIVFV